MTGTPDIASVADTGKLSLVRERLANLNRGMDRLRKAVEACGLERFSQVCAEIGFRGGLNDVPDAKVLRMLVEGMEAARRGQSSIERQRRTDWDIEKGGRHVRENDGGSRVECDTRMRKWRGIESTAQNGGNADGHEVDRLS